MDSETHEANLAKARLILMTDPVDNNYGDHARATLYVAEDLAVNSLRANAIDPTTLNLEVATGFMDRPDVTDMQKICLAFASFLTRVEENRISERGTKNPQLTEALIYNSIFAGALMHALDPGVLRKFEQASKFEEYIADRELGGEKSAVSKTNWYEVVVSTFNRLFCLYGHTKTVAQYEKAIRTECDGLNRYSAAVSKRIVGLCLYAKRHDAPELIDYLVENRTFPVRSKNNL